MNTLTKREKTMLYILLCFLIVVGGVFGLLLPAMNYSSDMQQKVDEAQMQQMLTSQTIMQAEQTQKAIVSAEAAWKAEKRYYKQPMQTEKVDSLVTALLLRHQLKIKSMTINPAEPAVIQKYDANASTVSGGTGTTSASNTASDEQKPAGQVTECRVNTIVVGAISDLNAMIDEINKTNGLRILSINSGTAGTESGNTTFTIQMVVYMLASS